MPLGTAIEFCFPFILSTVHKYQHFSHTKFRSYIWCLMVCHVQGCLPPWTGSHGDFLKFGTLRKWDPPSIPRIYYASLSPLYSTWCPNDFYIPLVTKTRILWRVFSILITFWKIPFTTFLTLVGPLRKIGLNWIALNRHFNSQATKHLY